MQAAETRKTYAAPSGTVPGIIYLCLSDMQLLNDLKTIQQNILSVLIEKGFPEGLFEVIPKQNLHLSLSKVFRILNSEVSSFISKLRTNLANTRNISFPLILKNALLMLDNRYICVEVDNISSLKITK